MIKQKLILLMTIIVIVILSIIKNNRKKTYGTVIILNDPSAAGKSSIQKEFQYLMMPNLWIKLGIDNLLINLCLILT